MRKMTVSLDGLLKADYVRFDPYLVIGSHPKDFTCMDFCRGEVFQDSKDRYFEIAGFGSSGLFGKDSNSLNWCWVMIRPLKRPKKNPDRYHIRICTRNPNEDCGGIIFSGWGSSVENCIRKHFPKEYTKKKTHPMYYSKLLKIQWIKMLDIETGEKTELEIKPEYDQILNNL